MESVASGTRTSSRVTRAFCTIRKAILCSCLTAENPGAEFSTMNPLTRPSATSRAQITVRSPKVAFPIHFFCPLRIHSSPSWRAVVCNPRTRPTPRRVR